MAEILPFGRGGVDPFDHPRAQAFYNAVAIQRQDRAADAGQVAHQAMFADLKLRSSGLPEEMIEGVEAVFYAPGKGWQRNGSGFYGMMTFHGTRVTMRYTSEGWRVITAEPITYGRACAEPPDSMYLRMTEDRIRVIERQGLPVDQFARQVEKTIGAADQPPHTGLYWTTPASA